MRENICIIYILLRIYKDLKSTKKDSSVEKWAWGLNGYFTKVFMATRKNIWWCLNSVVISRKKIKTALRKHVPEWFKLKKSISSTRRTRSNWCSHTLLVVGSIDGFDHLGKLNISISLLPGYSTLTDIQEKWVQFSCKEKKKA